MLNSKQSGLQRHHHRHRTVMSFRSIHFSSSPHLSLYTTIHPCGFLHLNLPITMLTMGLLCCVITCDGYCNPLDRVSLFSFSDSITTGTGSSPLDWNISVDCCTWEGVTCDIYGRVSSLKLPSRGLVGGISPSLADLSHLSQLNLSRNFLAGTLPEGIFGSLSHLQVIDLSYNRLFGQLPSSDMIPAATEFVDFSSNDFNGKIPPLFLKQAMNLVSFNISNNNFNGFIPCFICGISSSIKVLDFSSNHFSGSIPQDVQNCAKLETLRAGYNSLSGPLPQDIYRLSTLRHLSFPRNKLAGSLSNDISRLKNLRILSLHDNELTGIIPPAIGMLSNLEHLLLHVNKLDGTLPQSLTNCSRLGILILRVNFLSGDLSKFDFSRFTHLRTIDLGNNDFNGSLPTSLFACKSLKAVRLASNHLTGEIPANIPALESLSFLSISNNSITNVAGAIRILSRSRTLGTLILSQNFYNESLPDDYDFLDSQGFQNLQVLGLGRCNFKGLIPSWLGKLPKLKVLNLSSNFLTGSIPSFLGSLGNLFYLDLSENNLSGNFPVELTRMPRLATQQASNIRDETHLELPVLFQPYNLSDRQYNQLSGLPPAIYLSSNNLTGNIPVEIGGLKNILVLDLSDNSFSGGIPDTISYLSNLEKLDLSDNYFSGQIPASLGNLHFLSSFSVANNNLEGAIPTGGQFDTFPSTCFKGNKGLCGRILQHTCGGQPAKEHPPAKHSRKREIRREKIIFGLYVGVWFGVGFVISMLSMRNYEIEGSFLHAMLERLMNLRPRRLVRFPENGTN